ncbi:MAG: protein kinase [Polyangiaceae bacterium]|nr:protein kinase [Polyangiaceae bacterium]
MLVGERRLEQPVAESQERSVGCLDDIVVLELLEGGLSPDELARADAHLDGCETCRGVVASAVVARRPAGATPADEDDFPPGTHIGRFEVAFPIGEGAMGIVLAARDPDLDRRVAIKVLRPELGGDEARARMVREAQAMARLSHPNVVGVFDVGEVGGAAYFAMELVEGTTLRAWLAAEQRTTQEILDVFVQAGRGLAAAHQAGLVHRDFKPDNVLVGHDGRVRVGDFGLARASSPQDVAPDPKQPIEGALTRTGALLGTPAYMPPEQLEGRSADARSDQFSFAASLYEALHGTRPFAGSTVAELLGAIRRGDLRPASDRRVPRPIESAIARALAAAPSARHASMAALLRALAERDPRRGRMIVATSVTGLALVSALVFMVATRRTVAEPGICASGSDTFGRVWGREQASALRSSFEAKAPVFGKATADDVAGHLDRWGITWVEAYDDACRGKPGDADAVTKDARVACLDRELGEVGVLVTSLSGVDADGTAQAAGLVASLLPDVEKCSSTAALLGVSMPTDPEARQKVLASREATARARALLGLGQLSKAKDEARVAVEEARASKHGSTLGEALLATAQVARAAGSSEASSAAEEALVVLQEARDDRGVARATILIATIDGSRYDWERASQAATFARAAVARAGKLPSLEADLAEALGVVALAFNRYEESERELGRAMAIAKDLGEDQGARGARILTNLGNVARARAKLDLALERHRQAMQIDEKRLSAEHPVIGRHLHNIAGVLKLLGKRDEARSTYERALDITKRALGPDHPDVALTLNSLGVLKAEDRDFAAARASYREAIRIFSLHGHAQAAEVQRNLEQLEQAAAPAPASSARAPARPSGVELPKRQPSNAGTYMPSPAWP